MNLTLKILLIISAALYGCNQTPKLDSGSIETAPIETAPIAVDTTNKEIYDFMKEIIVSEKLDLTNRLASEPQQNCDLSESDNLYLNHFLIGAKKKTDTFDPKTGIYSVTNDAFDRCLTRDDINFMLSQKNENRGFKWNTSRLGFTTDNSEFWYVFSIPLFSRDRTKVIMMIRNLCPGLCGNGKTVLFKKENNKWVSKSIGLWMH